MKKSFKKLALHRDTLADLDRRSLQMAEGGTATSGYYTCNCAYSGRATCGTCEMTCTTNYC